MMIDENDRRNIAQWVATLLLIIVLESHVISRPIVFLLGPFVILISIYVARVSIQRWQRAWLIAALISTAGFLLTRYVFK